jgi:hypothetical protein
VGFVPLSEWSRIDLDDGTLDKGVCSDQLVVGGVIYLRRKYIVKRLEQGARKATDHTDNPCLPGNMLASPGKIAGI